MRIKKMTSVYLASPFSHESFRVEHDRYLEISRIAATLHLKYPRHVFFLPIVQSYAMCYCEPTLKGSFAAWKDRDLWEVATRDELWVVMMEGWAASIGVQAEIALAQQLKKKIRYINPITLKQTHKLVNIDVEENHD